MSPKTTCSRGWPTSASACPGVGPKPARHNRRRAWASVIGGEPTAGTGAGEGAGGEAGAHRQRDRDGAVRLGGMVVRGLAMLAPALVLGDLVVSVLLGLGPFASLLARMPACKTRPHRASRR